MRHSSNSKVLMFKHPLEQKFSVLFNNLNGIDNIGSLSPEDVCDFEFISNFQAIHRNSFGYLRSRHTSNPNGSAPNALQQNPLQNVPGGGLVGSSIDSYNAAVGGPTTKQPPISRPTATSVSSALNGLNGSGSTQGASATSLVLSSLIGNNGTVTASSASIPMTNHSSNVISNGLAQGIANLATLSSNSPCTVSSLMQHSHQQSMLSQTGSANSNNSVNTNSNHVNGAGSQQQQSSNSAANILANGINGIHLGNTSCSTATTGSALKSMLGHQQRQNNNTHHQFGGSPSSPLPSLSLNQSLNSSSSYNSHNSSSSLCQNQEMHNGNSNNGNLFENGLLSKRMNGGATLGSLLNGVSEYEKWSNGSNRYITRLVCIVGENFRILMIPCLGLSPIIFP